MKRILFLVLAVGVVAIAGYRLTALSSHGTVATSPTRPFHEATPSGSAAKPRFPLPNAEIPCRCTKPTLPFTGPIKTEPIFAASSELYLGRRP